MMENNMGMEGGKCGCKCHNFVGWFVVLLGLVFLLGQFNVFTEGFVNIAWPVLVILIGLKMSLKGMCKCCMPK